MPLAHEYFLVAHDVGTGKLRLNLRAAGVGLAGAMISDLILANKVHVASGSLTVVTTDPPEDDLSYRVYRQLAADQQTRSLRTWLAFFSQGAVERVAVELVRSGKVEAVQGRRLFTTTVRYLPTDTEEAVWPADRLYGLVSRNEPMNISDAALAGLVAVTGLTKHVWQHNDPLTLRHVTAAVSSLPMSLREVLSHTEAAVGDVTLSPHR